MQTPRRLQRTLARETEVRGVGFLEGHDVSLRFRPAKVDSGVVFVRTDLPGRPSVRACVDNVVPRQRRTTVRRGEATVEMVEHVMAALAGLRVDNCVVEIDAPETPGCDGSSLAFVDALAAAGTVELDRPRGVLVIDRPFVVREGKAALTAYPGGGASLVLSYQLDYGEGSPIRAQSRFVELSPDAFVSELAPSRTFLLEAEADALRAAGVGSRATFSDLLIFGPDGVVGNTLRYADECARHKILDMVGDLALVEKDLIGHVVAHRTGHQHNVELGRALLAASGGGAPGGPFGGGGLDGVPLDVDAITSLLPHRYPFLLIDRVTSWEPGVSLTAVKDLGANEPYFQGPGPGRPAMPGVLILEALAQAGGLLISRRVDRARKVTMIAAVDGAKIRRPVRPGDRLVLEATCLRAGGTAAQVRGVAKVADRVAAEAKLTFVTTDADRSAA